jgi:hypothetical protein
MKQIQVRNSLAEQNHKKKGYKYFKSATQDTTCKAKNTMRTDKNI